MSEGDIKQRIVLEDGVTPALDAMTKAIKGSADALDKLLDSAQSMSAINTPPAFDDMTKAIRGSSDAIDKLLDSAQAISAINTSDSRDNFYQLELELKEVSAAFNRAREDAQQMAAAASGVDLSQQNKSSNQMIQAAKVASAPQQQRNDSQELSSLKTLVVTAEKASVEGKGLDKGSLKLQPEIDDKRNSALTGLIDSARKITGVIMIAVGAIKSLREAFEMADARSNERAQLSLLSDEARNGLSADEIRDYAGKYANRVGMSSNDFMSQSLQLLNSTGGAFGSIGEAMNYNELMQKQMKIAGVSGQAADSVSLQWRQGLTKGFASQEINSVLENAPVLAERLAKTMQIPLADLKDAAAAGQVTADVAKRALFENADEIESQFAEMPKTWEMIGAQLENGMMSALDPVLQAISDLANSGIIEEAVTMIQNGLMVAFDVAKWLFNMVQKNIFPVFKSLAANVKSLFGEGTSGASLIMELIARAKLLIENVMMAIQGVTKTVVGIVSSVSGIITNITIGIKNLAIRIKKIFDWSNNEQYLDYNTEIFEKARENIADGLLETGIGIDKALVDLFADSDAYEDSLKAVTDAFESLDAENDMNAKIGATPTRPLYTKQVGSTKIDKSSLQYLKEMAQAEIINRVNNIQPSISATFGDVHQTADVDGMIQRLEDDFKSARGQNLMLKTGMAFVG